MRRLENLLGIMDCPARFQVALAAYQFKEEAEYWWEAIRPRGDKSLITRETLKELMDIKYYPMDYKRANEREFSSLK